jgi:transcriptional regulator with XRE-family HTH domain
MRYKQLDYKKNLGMALREMRNQQGISQEAYADKFAINRTYYGKVERGENSISLDKLESISNNLKIPLSELFKHAENLD